MHRCNKEEGFGPLFWFSEVMGEPNEPELLLFSGLKNENRNLKRLKFLYDEMSTMKVHCSRW